MKKLSIIIIFLVLVINGVYANNLKIGVQSFQNIDPIVTTAIDDYQVISSIYDTLILFTDGELLPQLAIKWEWLSDKELRVQLRKGVKWHNGKLFSAEDVKYSFDRMKPYKTGYSWFFKAIENEFGFEEDTIMYDDEIEYGPSYFDKLVDYVWNLFVIKQQQTKRKRLWGWGK